MKNSLQNVQARQQQILEQLQSGKLLYIRDLSRHFNVSEVTIRRDLNALEHTAQLKRVFGGVRMSQEPEELPNSEPELNLSSPGLFSQRILTRQALHAEEKDLICKKVATLLENDEIVFMNSGTTVLYLLRYVANKHLHVFTNNAAIALVERPADVEMTITGGEHFVRTQSMVGSIAKDSLSRVIATSCILGVSGISAANGITTTLHQEREINNIMLHNCEGKHIVAADPSKIGRSHSFITCPIQDIDILVTLSTADEEEIRKIQDCGVQVIFADQPD
ncbi:DeoR/GlpR transcriptional regulator [Pseudoflavonifractor sp. AF19-9AC]|uniref:DeoR/GlpR family DNA-binding transcription regulator n=1 Tax=Pseudoflavonifractor sp. AF19-9AC TaxID=2292244 RepID=UPI000E50666A|nr:DeoR/GlpR family DNA-binding transcription regulator [Pseudoflavonifractor sp. AF19-9AC]RHR08046.1 DeoR/GlpR transcriptional regulator [Pseudoflavonifractor sp. AF19-9AC]